MDKSSRGPATYSPTSVLGYEAATSTQEEESESCNINAEDKEGALELLQLRRSKAPRPPECFMDLEQRPPRKLSPTLTVKYCSRETLDFGLWTDEECVTPTRPATTEATSATAAGTSAHTDNDVRLCTVLRPNSFLVTDLSGKPVPNGNLTLVLPLNTTDGYSSSCSYGYIVHEKVQNCQYGSIFRAEKVNRICTVQKNPFSAFESNEELIMFRLTEERLEFAVKTMNLQGVDKSRGDNPHLETTTGLKLKAFMSEDPHFSNVSVPIEVLETTDSTGLLLVMPFYNCGDLFELVFKKGKLSPQESYAWFRQIIMGIRTLQSHGVCHRDISCENVMIQLDSKNFLNADLIDFGMAVHFNPSMKNILFPPMGVYGKPFYISPEIKKNGVFDPRKIDIWAAGVCLFCMLTGQALGDDGYLWVLNGRLRQLLDHWKVIDDNSFIPELVDLLEGMLCVDFRKRLSVDEVLVHPWMEIMMTNAKSATLGLSTS